MKICKNAAFIEEGKECFSLISKDFASNSSKIDYVCYYPDKSCPIPYALTQRGVQVPTKDGVKLLTYEELQTLVLAGVDENQPVTKE